MKIMIFSGSPRRADDCPGQVSKSRILVQYIMDSFPQVEWDLCDLAVAPDNLVSPCKGCYSTSAFHCHWPCTCYAPGGDDLMHNKNIYGRMREADKYIIVTPVHWYNVTTQLKAMFDRLVCASRTITAQDAKLYQIGKDIRKTTFIENSGKLDSLRKDWLEGKEAAIIVHGDLGADDVSKFGLPNSLQEGKQEEDATMRDIRSAVMPIVHQMRYSGITVKNDNILSLVIGAGMSYSNNNETFLYNHPVFIKSKELVTRFTQ
jgi:multimeric flavodoxin WrbA